MTVGPSVPYSPQQLVTAETQAGYTGQSLITQTAIALAESGGNPRSNELGDVGLETATWGPSVSPFQIRSLNSQSGTGQLRDELANLNLTTAAQHAFQVSAGGTNFQPWSTYTGGQYRSYLAEAAAAVASVTGTAQAGATPAGNTQLASWQSSLGSIVGGNPVVGTWQDIGGAAGSVAGSVASGTVGAVTSWASTYAIRAGLVIFGAIMVLAGLAKLTGNGGGGGSSSTPAQSARKARDAKEPRGRPARPATGPDAGPE